MRIAITGASGFVGRHVLRALANTDAEVIAVVRSALQDFEFNGRTVKLNMCDASPDAFKLIGQPDVLLHLAWGGLPNYRSLSHFTDELPIHYRFIESLVRSGLETIVVAGTCFEYGMQSGELHEGLPTNPANPYGYAKDALRRQLQYLQSVQSFRLIWPRIFYLYGDGQSEGALYSQLSSAAKRGQPYFDMSLGEQLRDYLPADEVGRLLVTLAMKQTDIGAINVCSGRPISVRRLVEGWIQENGWSIKPNLGKYPYPDYEPFAFWGSRLKLKGVLQND